MKNVVYQRLCEPLLKLTKEVSYHHTPFSYSLSIYYPIHIAPYPPYTPYSDRGKQVQIPDAYGLEASGNP
jgi:hypothetical protein